MQDGKENDKSGEKKKEGEVSGAEDKRSVSREKSHRSEKVCHKNGCFWRLTFSGCNNSAHPIPNPVINLFKSLL